MQEATQSTGVEIAKLVSDKLTAATQTVLEGAGAAWPVLVKETQTRGLVMGGFWLAILTASICFGVWMARRCDKASEENNPNKGGYAFGVFVSVVFSAVALICLGIQLHTAAAPNLALVEKILEAVK